MSGDVSVVKEERLGDWELLEVTSDCSKLIYPTYDRANYTSGAPVRDVQARAASLNDLDAAMPGSAEVEDDATRVVDAEPADGTWVCEQCGNPEAFGNFCGKCGSPRK